MNAICEGTTIHGQNLDHFGTRLDMVNEVLRRRVMTRAQKRIQLDRLKQALDQNTKEGLLNNNSSNSYDKFNSSDNFDDVYGDFDAMRGSLSADKSNHDFEGLPDNYLCSGLPDTMLMEALKELNISDIKDFLNNDKSKPFEKQKLKPPPQYHLESGHGDTKDRLTAFQLQSYFGGRQLKEHNLLSKLGTGLSVMDNDQEIPTVGEMVNHKQGK